MAEVNTTTSSSSNSIDEAARNEKGTKKSKKISEKADAKTIMVPATDLYAHLPEAEAKIIKRQVEVPEVKTSFTGLYRYASKFDLMLVILAQIAAIIGGALLPLMTVIFGQLTGVFSDFAQQKSTPAELRHEISRYTLYFVYLAIAEFAFVYFATVASIYTGEHIAGKIRERYLAAVLRQNIGFFDYMGAGEVATRITSDTNLIATGISEKTTLTSSALATFIAAFVIGFVRNWRLTLILTSTIVAINLIFAIGGSFIVKYSKANLNSFAEGGTVAEEVLSSIRNTVAFGTQKTLADQYDKHLNVAEGWGIKQKRSLAIMIACMMCIVYLNYGLAFWQGSRFLVSGEANVQSIITVLMSILIGAFALGNVAPSIGSFTTAIAASGKIYGVIDRKSPMDVESEEGQKLAQVVGEIELRDIKMIYPSRPEVCVIEKMNLVIPAGKVTALVGASGSGKSTIVGLVERFYDPVGGQVLFDGHNVKDLNLKWLREQVALVQQQPILFNTTIYQNIAFGLIGTPYENASVEEKRALVAKACETSNAAQFIALLPEGYETNVGERGFALSGGQKQRISIARAVVSDPKILLLDEATSALDTRSEGVVQAALDKASKGRTTITIAHRLSTIKNADNIVVMQRGVIVESGKHDALLEARGAYYNLVEAQKFQEESADEVPKTELDSKMLEVELIRSAQERPEINRSQTKASVLTRTETKTSIIGNAEDAELAGKLNRTATLKSVASIALAGRKEKEYEQYSLGTLIKLIASFNKPEWPYMFIALLASIVAGAGYPVQSVFFSKAIVALSRPPSQIALIKHDSNFWSLMFLMLAIVQFFAYMTQGVIFAYCSERLVHRVRDRAFRAMLRQEVAFFDRDENSAGALTSFLSTQTTHVAGLSGQVLGTLFQVLTTLIAAVCLSIAIGWKLGLVCTSTIPILLGCGYLRFWLLARFEQRSKKAYEKSASYACEATGAIRTVASLTREKDVYNQYHKQI